MRPPRQELSHSKYTVGHDRAKIYADSETVRVADPAHQAAARDRIAAELAAIAAPAWPCPAPSPTGALAAASPAAAATQTRPACTARTPNGPARSAARPSADGSPPDQLAEYQPLFDNAKKLRTLLSDLQDLTLQIIETGSTREPSTPPEPEPAAPENVGEARLTCGQPSSQTPFAAGQP